MADLHLDILTPTGPAEIPGLAPGSLEVPGVEVPGLLGEVGVLPGHVPFVTPVVPGVLRFRFGGDDVRLAVGSGFLEVGADGRVTVLTERALGGEQIDVDAARKELEEVSAQLRDDKSAIDAPEHMRLVAREAWCQAQLRAANAAN